MTKDLEPAAGVKKKIYDVIFGYESKAGKIFDIGLICMILISISAVLLDSVSSINIRFGNQLTRLEWFFTVVFTIEYAMRLFSTPNRRAYMLSFYGIIDLFSILPTYIAFLFPAAAYMVVIRILRVLRIFRILKLLRYMGEANLLFSALLNARRKIFIFLFSVMTLVVIFGAVMFVLEGPEHGFDNIPKSIYWAIVTITTVGYGDISPQTPLGQMVASVVMICGYAIIAVPTGIIGVELMQEVQRRGRGTLSVERECARCKTSNHDMDANYCKYCGNPMQRS
ncbi:MAG: ion transporter [Proteobacteria bacterium]|nr:ion transporter [Pseudomonadota bacterium]